MSDEDGFTLIELLVAMAASALLLGVLSWVILSLGRDLSSSRTSHDADDVAAARPVLVSLLEGASADPSLAMRFEGRADGLSAVVDPPAALGPVGPVRLDLAVKQDRDGARLEAGLSAVRSGATLPSDATGPRVLVAKMWSIVFDYVRRPSTSGLATPEQITIRFVDDTGELPPLVIQPRVNSTAACVFDPISMTCRR